MELIIAGTVLFTIVSPFINAYIQRVTWTPKQKSLVAWAVAIVIATVYVLATGGIANLYQLLLAAPVIYGYGQAIYQFFVKNLATKFEALTTKGSVIVSPSETEGKIDITSDATIKITGDSITVDPPVQVTPDLAKSGEPEQIILESNVKG